MNPTVSIIIPVYNAEATLRRCVNSVLKQEYADFELLLVDDGSRDASGAICDEFAAMDGRVRVIHKPNTGVSDTRNTAIEQARGAYLQFLDSDDWITPDATRLLVRTAQTHSCDLVIADFYRVVGERVSHKSGIGEDGVLTREDYAAHMMESPARFYYGVLWNKLYRRDIVMEHSLRMNPEIQFCEDFMFNLEYIRHARTFCALQVPIYYYVKTKNSLVSQTGGLLDVIKIKRMVFEYYNRFYKSVLDEEEYEQSRLKVYRFFIDSATDGVVPPAILPGAQKLGDERVSVSFASQRREGAFWDVYRGRRLLDHMLEIVSLKHSLSDDEARLLLCLRQTGSVTRRRDLANLANMTHRRLSATLQKLTGQKLIRVENLRRSAPGAAPNQIYVTFLPAAAPILADLDLAVQDMDRIRLADFSDDDLTQYEQLSSRIAQNIQRVLGESRF